MKQLKIITLIILSTAFSLSCSMPDNQSKKVVIVNESDVLRKTIGVNGMTCVGCEVTLEDNIAKIEGVVSVKASHTDKEAIIEFDSTKTDIITITKKIKESGYKPYSK